MKTAYEWFAINWFWDIYLDNITGVRTFFKESISVLEKIKNNSFCYSYWITF